MPATKSGTYINITGTGNTLASMYSDINDNNWIERTTDVDGSYIYSVKSAIVNYIVINHGGELTVGNPNDYSFKETLRNIYSTNGRGYITIYQSNATNENGILKLYGNSTIDFINGMTAPNQYSGSWNCYGSIIVEGNAIYKPNLKLGNGLFLWFNYGELENDLQTPKAEVKRFKHCKITNPRLELSNSNSKYIDEFTFEDVDIEFNSNITQVYYHVINVNNSIYYGGFSNLTQVKFKNLNIINLPCRFSYDNFAGMIENAYIVNTVNTNAPLYYTSVREAPLFLSAVSSNNNNEFIYISEKTAQKFAVYLKDVYQQSVHIFIPISSNMVLWENVTMDSTKNYLQIHSGRNLILYNSDLIYNFPTYRLDFGEKSTMKKCYKLDLIVKDENGTVIPDATITIIQKDNKEKYICYTNSLGKIYSFYNLDCIFLANRVRTKPTKSSAVIEDIWSDSSNNTYHTVSIYKPGFKPLKFNVVIDRDRAVDVVLKPIGQIQKLRGTVRQYKLSGIVKQFKLKGKVKRNG